MVLGNVHKKLMVRKVEVSYEHECSIRFWHVIERVKSSLPLVEHGVNFFLHYVNGISILLENMFSNIQVWTVQKVFHVIRLNIGLSQCLVSLSLKYLEHQFYSETTYPTYEARKTHFHWLNQWEFDITFENHCKISEPWYRLNFVRISNQVLEPKT